MSEIHGRCRQKPGSVQSAAWSWTKKSTAWRITNELLGRCGQSLSAPEKVGKVCELTVGFKKAGGEELMTAWQYGSESQGPPPEICNFVIAAVEATTPWYEQQKAMVRRAGQQGGDKKWWQFWK
jgi:hypothetical protein